MVIDNSDGDDGGDDGGDFDDYDGAVRACVCFLCNCVVLGGKEQPGGRFICLSILYMQQYRCYFFPHRVSVDATYFSEVFFFLLSLRLLYDECTVLDCHNSCSIFGFYLDCILRNVSSLLWFLLLPLLYYQHFLPHSCFTVGIIIISVCIDILLVPVTVPNCHKSSLFEFNFYYLIHIIIIRKVPPLHCFHLFYYQHFFSHTLGFIVGIITVSVCIVVLVVVICCYCIGLS